MRPLVIALSALGCSEPPLPAQPLPPLEAPRTPSSLAGSRIALWPGESMSWKVRWRGLEIGVATLEVSGLARTARVHSAFSPTKFAAQLRPAGHDLVTPLDPGDRPDHLHSALGRVRGWVGADASPAELVVVHDGERFRVRLAEPALEEPMDAPPVWRVEGQARSRRSDVELALTLSTDADRVPLSAVVDLDGKTVTAELLDYSRGR